MRRLHDMGLEVAMITGDSEDVARAVAADLGIDTYFAQVLPEAKDSHVAELQRQGKRVAMVGDGVNDAPALVRADVGIAIGSGTNVAVESAGIILVRDNPLDVAKVVELSRASYAKMVQNLLWATGYNVVALPLAAGVLAPFGIVLSPRWGPCSCRSAPSSSPSTPSCCADCAYQDDVTGGAGSRGACAHPLGPAYNLALRLARGPGRH